MLGRLSYLIEIDTRYGVADIRVSGNKAKSRQKHLNQKITT